MKTKYWYPLLFLTLLFSQLKTSAQQEVKRLIELKLTDSATKAIHLYRLNGANYFVSHPFSALSESKQAPEDNCKINMDLASEVDQFLLKWISGEIKDVSGVINMGSKDSPDKVRKVAFTGGKVAASSENFINADMETSTQMSLYVKTLSIDNVPVFAFPGN